MQICKFYKVFFIPILLFIPFLSHAQVVDETVINDEFAYANKLLRDNYPELAIVQFQLFVKKYPAEKRLAEAMRRIAESYQELGQFPEARTSYERLNVKFPYSPFARDAYFQIARCYAAEENFASAAEFFELYARFSSDAENACSAMLQAGKLNLKLGKRERGRKLLFETIDLYPGNVSEKAAAQQALLYDFIASGETQRAFRIADQFLREFPQALAGAQVWLVKARLHKSLGQLKKALTVYDNVLSSYKNSQAALMAQIESADILFLIGERKKAFARLTQAMNGKNDSLAAVAQVTKAGLLLQDGQNQAAFETTEAALRFAELGYRRYLTLGRIHEKLENYTAAFAAYEKALANKPALPDSLVAQIHYQAARAAYRQGNAEVALTSLRRAREKNPGQILHARILQLEGDVYLNLLDDTPFAIRTYSRFISNFPHNPQIDEVQFRLARCYEKKQNWSMALDEWRRLVKLYPASEQYPIARRHITLIEKYRKPDLTALLSAALQESQNDRLQKARKLVALQSWTQATAVLWPILQNDEEEKMRSAAAQLLAQCYFARANIALLQDESDEFALFDSTHLLLQWPGASWEEETERREKDRMLAIILQQNVLTEIPAQLDSISRKYQNDAAFTALHQMVLHDRINHIDKTDSLAVARLQQRVQNFAANVASGNSTALNLQARLALAIGDTTGALAAFEKIDFTMAGPTVAQGKLSQAYLYMQLGKNEAASKLLQDFRKRYFYSVSIAQANYLLARIAFSRDDYPGVLRWLQYIDQNDNWDIFPYGDGLAADISFLKAQNAVKMADRLAASNLMLQFLKKYQLDARAPQVLFQLAEITAEQKFVRLAREYYQNFLARYKKDPLAGKVRIALARLEFDEHRYVRAREIALRAMAETTANELEAEATYLAVLAQLRRGKIQSVANELKIFRKKFPSHESFYGDIQYELGEAYIRDKNFKKAEKVFKNLRKDLKKTTFAVRGEFGLARSYLIRNKTDEGLEILKQLPQKYSGDPFLREVHIQLGDFYQTQKMWQSAITAYNFVISDTLVDEKYKAVLIKLIDLYGNIGLSDAAISYARYFIKYFPNDEREFDYRLKIATLYRDKQDYEQAIAVYRRLLPLAHGENKAEILFFLGDSYYNLQRYEQAAAEFLKMKYFVPKTKQNWRTTALFKAGDCYLRLENLPKARALFDLVRRLEGEASVFGRSAKKRIKEIDAAMKKNGNTGLNLRDKPQAVTA